MSYSGLKLAELKQQLASRNLPTNGNKDELVNRIMVDDERIDRENGIISVYFKSLTGSFTTIKINKMLKGSDLVDAFVAHHNGLYTAQKLRISLWDGRALDLNRTLDDQRICNGCTIEFRVRLI